MAAALRGWGRGQGLGNVHEHSTGQMSLQVGGAGAAAVQVHAGVRKDHGIPMFLQPVGGDERFHEVSPSSVYRHSTTPLSSPECPHVTVWYD